MTLIEDAQSNFDYYVQSRLNERDASGQTALDHALIEGFPDLAVRLIKAGAKAPCMDTVNRTLEEQVIVHYYGQDEFESGYEDVFKILKVDWSDIEQVDTTPLHLLLEHELMDAFDHMIELHPPKEVFRKEDKEFHETPSQIAERHELDSALHSIKQEIES